jgi:hypothetical protein
MKLGDEVLPSTKKMELLELTSDTYGLLTERAASWQLTLEDALVRLLHSGASVEPAPPKAKVPMHPDGAPYCKCDGSFNFGPHHRCHRYRKVEQAEGDYS